MREMLQLMHAVYHGVRLQWYILPLDYLHPASDGFLICSFKARASQEIVERFLNQKGN